MARAGSSAVYVPPVCVPDPPQTSSPVTGQSVTNYATALADAALLPSVVTTGDYAAGQVYLPQAQDLVAWGADVLWPSTGGAFTVKLWDQTANAVAASCVAVPAPASTGVVRCPFDAPVNLNPARVYVLAINDDGHQKIWGMQSAEPLSLARDLWTAPGLLLPAGDGRSAYAHPSGTIPVAQAQGWTTPAQLLTTHRSTLASPFHGQTGVDLYQPLSWTPCAQATGYRLRVGTTAGASDVYYSGDLLATGPAASSRLARHIPGLAVSTTYHVTVETKINAAWVVSEDTVFTTASTDSGWPASADYGRVFAAASLVRQMADTFNNLMPLTILDEFTRAAGGTQPTCLDFAATLVDLLTSMRVRGARVASIGFHGGGTDVHSIAEVLDSDGYKVIDPTFGLAVYLTSTGRLATSAQIQTAALTKAWPALRFRMLDTTNPNSRGGRAYAEGYYLDYPLLYLNIPPTQTPQADLAPYITDTGLTSLTAPGTTHPWVSSGGAYYLVIGATPGAITVTIDGVPTALTASAAGYTSVFFGPAGASVAIVSPGAATLASPQRFVF